MEQTVKHFLYLVSSAVNEKPVDQRNLINLDLNALFHFAMAHQMASIVAFALDSVNIQDNRFVEAKLRAINQTVVLDYERRRIANELSKAQIWYMPLKGAILKAYYPHIGMREMCDIDILYDKKYSLAVKNIMESLGFDMKPPDGIDHQEVYQKPPFCTFEMHPMLFDDWTDEKYVLYYREVKPKLLGDGYEKHFSNEDFYIYMITHMHKHFYWGGTGLRSLLDIYIFLKRFDGHLDWKYIYTEARKIGIDEFEKKSRTIANKIFGEENTDGLSAEEKDMLSYFVSSGAYGNKQFVIQNRMEKVGLIQYFRERIFLPMKGVEYHYPLFYRHKILLPFLPIYRLFHGLKNVRSEMSVIRKLSQKKKSDSEQE